MTAYRDRIYSAYVTARDKPMAPQTLAGLQSRAPYIERIIHRHFPSDRSAKIVDLGCGHGAFVHFVRKAGYINVEGIDGAPEQVAAAQHLGIQGVRRGSILEELTAMPDQSCDVIIAFDVIEHFTRNELLGFVDKVYRVLKTGGRWIIHTPNGESPFAGRMFFWDFTHELAFTRTSIAQLLYASKYSEVRSYEDVPVPHGVKSVIRWLLWKGIRGGLRLYLAVETGDTNKETIFSQNFLTVAVK